MLIRQITKRFISGQDLRKEIENIVEKEKIKAGVLVSIVGSVNRLRLRVAGGKTVKEWGRRFEIVSGTGTISNYGCHIHISASGQSGKTVGGHLKEGCIVDTTVELVLIIFDGVVYKRTSDPATGFSEISI